MGVSSILKKIMSEYEGRIRLVIKNVPYGSREYAVGAALAALASGEQGKYWEMHDKIFEKWPELDPATMIKHAKDLGLDRERFRQSMASRRLKDAIERDMKLGDDLHVYMTPTFFINGKKYVGEMTYREFKKIIENELKETR